MTIRVLVVDDSALVRQVLMEVLSSDPEIEVVGVAVDPFAARDKIKRLNPDVLTLDVEMPRMDGLTFLENLMRLHPMPVVMVSSLTERGAQVTLDALEIGAVDFVTKPKLGVAHGLREYGVELIEKVKMASKARVKENRPAGNKATPMKAGQLNYRTTDRLLAIGASAGGTEAIRVVLEQMPPDAPGIVITQHIPAGFSRAFAERMNRCSAMAVCEAQDGQPITPGQVYIAPGSFHLSVVRSGARWHCRVADGEPVSRHKPSVDVLFDSVARHAGANAVGAILTGMGYDGAQGMLRMKEAHAPTLAQDEATSLVWGMPGSAVKAGAVQEILPLENIAARMLALAARL